MTDKHEHINQCSENYACDIKHKHINENHNYDHLACSFENEYPQAYEVHEHHHFDPEQNPVHKHYHEHGEDCDCECEHTHVHEEHSHPHGEQCTYGHCAGEGAVKILMHEGAVAASFSKNFVENLETVEIKLMKLIESLGSKVTKGGALIGHIKATVTSGEYACMFSLTSKEVNIKRNEGKKEKTITLSFAAIILKTEAEELRTYLGKIYNAF